MNSKIVSKAEIDYHLSSIFCDGVEVFDLQRGEDTFTNCKEEYMTFKVMGSSLLFEDFTTYELTRSVKYRVCYDDFTWDIVEQVESVYKGKLLRVTYFISTEQEHNTTTYKLSNSYPIRRYWDSTDTVWY